MQFLDAKRLSKREIDLEIYVIMQLYRDLPMSQFIAATRRIDELRVQRDLLDSQAELQAEAKRSQADHLLDDDYDGQYDEYEDGYEIWVESRLS
jgi:hypothetical protein